ncbi:MAG: hypothetical protein OXC44_04150 [Proteobacteria bacterium]|nr:hypothetical protein [Pseudomonadota bacterium]
MKGKSLRVAVEVAVEKVRGCIQEIMMTCKQRVASFQLDTFKLKWKDVLLPTAIVLCVVIYWLEGESWKTYRKTLDTHLSTAEEDSAGKGDDFARDVEVLVRVDLGGSVSFKSGETYLLTKYMPSSMLSAPQRREDVMEGRCVLGEVYVYAVGDQTFIGLSRMHDVFVYKKELSKDIYLLSKDKVYVYPSCPEKRVVYRSFL